MSHDLGGIRAEEILQAFATGGDAAKRSLAELLAGAHRADRRITQLLTTTRVSGKSEYTDGYFAAFTHLRHPMVKGPYHRESDVSDQQYGMSLREPDAK